MTGKQNHINCITGMHRSGTSLVAKWLKTCGLNLGKNLLKGDYTNPHGHFEDLDILHFHENVLHHNNESYFTTSSKIPWTEQHRKEALDLINPKIKTNWAWKEPRTSLFLKQWKNLIPSLKYVFIVRHPFEVANSLLKREIQMLPFWKRPFINKSKYLIEAINVWINYNLHILNYCKGNDKEYVLFDLSTILSNSEAVIEKINDVLNLSLNPTDIKAQLDEKLLNRTPLQISNSSSSKAIEVYEQLLSFQTAIQ